MECVEISTNKTKWPWRIFILRNTYKLLGSTMLKPPWKQPNNQRRRWRKQKSNHKSVKNRKVKLDKNKVKDNFVPLRRPNDWLKSRDAFQFSWRCFYLFNGLGFAVERFELRKPWLKKLSFAHDFGADEERWSNWGKVGEA